MGRKFTIKNGVLEEYEGNDKEVVIPDGVTEIGENAFWKCKRLTSITIPDSVTKIGRKAFEYCHSLAEVRNFDKFLLRGGKVGSYELINVLANDGGQLQTLILAFIFMTANTAIQICKDEMGKQADKSFATVVDYYEKTPVKPAVYKKVIDFALEYHKSVDPADIKRLYDIMLANKAAKAAEPLIPYLPTADGKTPEKTLGNDTEKSLDELYNKFNVEKKLKGYNIKGVKYKDGKKVPDFVLQCVFYAYAEQLEEKPSFISRYKTDYSDFSFVPEVDKIAETFDPESFQKLIADLTKKLAPKDFAIFAPLCRFADSNNIASLATGISKWENWSAYSATGRAAIIVMRGALLLNDTREAVIRAEKMNILDAYAKIRGATAQSIRDNVMIDFGLDENGEKIYDLGGTTVKAYMENDLSIALFDVTNGKTVKSLPKKNADAEKYDKCGADLKDLKKNIKKAVSERVKILRTDFLDGADIPVADYKKVYIGNAVIHKIASTLVWRVKDAKTCFIPTDDGKLALYDGTEFTLPETGAVCLAHPMDIPADETENWKKYLSDRNIAQTFTQIYEPVYDLKKIDVKSRYKDLKIPLAYLRRLEREGMTIKDQLCGYDLELELKGHSINADIVQGKNEKPWGSLNAVYSINSVPKGSSVFIENCSLNKDASEKRKSHEIFALDSVFLLSAVNNGNVKSLADLANGITAKNIDELISAAQESEQTECLAWLMNYKNKHFGFTVPDLVLE